MAEQSQWTLETLKEYFDGLRNSDEKRYLERFNASDKAITKAEDATERRFQGVNEFRSAMSDQARLMMPRAEAEALQRNTESKIQAVLDKILAIEKQRSEDLGANMARNAAARQMNWLIGIVIVVLMALAGFVFRQLKM